MRLVTTYREEAVEVLKAAPLGSFFMGVDANRYRWIYVRDSRGLWTMDLSDEFEKFLDPAFEPDRSVSVVPDADLALGPDEVLFSITEGEFKVLAMVARLMDFDSWYQWFNSPDFKMPFEVTP